MITADRISTYATDFLAFANDLVIPAAGGPARFGDVMADFQREAFFAISPNLEKVSRGEIPEKKYFWLERTKGASKDSDLGVACLWALAFGSGGRPILIEAGANDASQADELRRAMKDVVLLNPLLADVLEVQSTSVVNRRTSARLEIIASDAAGAHGSRPTITIINELSHIGREEFALTMADNSGKVAAGLMMVATNAGQLGTWQHRWMENAATSAQWHFSKVDKPAPWISERDLIEAKRRNPASRYARLWQGRWVAVSGDALDESDIEASIVHEGPMFTREEGYVFAGGLDLSQKRDFSGFVVLAAKLGTGRVRLAWAEFWKPSPGHPVDLASVHRSILSARARYGLRIVFADEWQTAYLGQLLAHDGVTVEAVKFGPGGQSAMATAILTSFRDRRIELYRHDQLLADLAKLSIVERPGGLKLEAPRGPDGHADVAFALAAALPTVLTGGRRGGTAAY